MTDSAGVRYSLLGYPSADNSGDAVDLQRVGEALEDEGGGSHDVEAHPLGEEPPADRWEYLSRFAFLSRLVTPSRVVPTWASPFSSFF
jgi:hypothetical protein